MNFSNVINWFRWSSFDMLNDENKMLKKKLEQKEEAYERLANKLDDLNAEYLKNEAKCTEANGLFKDMLRLERMENAKNQVRIKGLEESKKTEGDFARYKKYVQILRGEIVNACPKHGARAFGRFDAFVRGDEK